MHSGGPLVISEEASIEFHGRNLPWSLWDSFGGVGHPSAQESCEVL